MPYHLLELIGGNVYWVKDTVEAYVFIEEGSAELVLD